MPLFIIAIIFLIGLLIYLIVGYKIGDFDHKPVKIKFPEKFARRKTDINYTVVVEDEEEDSNETQGF